MVPGLRAPSTRTFVPNGSEPESQPFVSLAEPVPEQCAAWPMKVLPSRRKMKFEVHWAPLVNVWFPGWILFLSLWVAEAVAGRSTSAARRAAAASRNDGIAAGVFRIMPSR